VRSRIAYPTTDIVDIVRRTTDRVNGRIVEGAANKIYTNIAANIRDVVVRGSAPLGKPSESGMVAERQYQVGLGGPYMPNSILRGDYVRVYWGTYPNLYSSPSIPRNYSPHLLLKTPAVEKLVWQPNSNAWVGPNYKIQFNNGWAIYLEDNKIGDLGTEFDVPKIDCMLPEGLQLFRLTGPPIDLKILLCQHKMDDRGRWHHTAMIAEHSETDSGVKI
jgi:hypothetical protein